MSRPSVPRACFEFRISWFGLFLQLVHEVREFQFDGFESGSDFSDLALDLCPHFQPINDLSFDFFFGLFHG